MTQPQLPAMGFPRRRPIYACDADRCRGGEVLGAHHPHSVARALSLRSRRRRPDGAQHLNHDQEDFSSHPVSPRRSLAGGLKGGAGAGRWRRRLSMAAGIGGAVVGAIGGARHGSRRPAPEGANLATRPLMLTARAPADARASLAATIRGLGLPAEDATRRPRHGSNGLDYRWYAFVQRYSLDDASCRRAAADARRTDQVHGSQAPDRSGEPHMMGDFVDHVDNHGCPTCADTGPGGRYRCCRKH